MRRRALLSALVTTSIAGCNGLGTDGGGRTTRPPLDVDTPTPTATESPFDQPAVTPSPSTGTEVGPDRRLVSLRADGVPDGFTVEAGFVGPVTRDHPGLLWVGLRNTSASETTLDLGATPPVSDYRFGGGEQTLYLVPVSRPQPTEGLRLWNDCWKTRSQSVVEVEDTTRSVTVPSDATVGGLYGLAVMRGADFCLPMGRYEVAGDGGWSLGLSVFDSGDNAPSASQFEGASPPPLGTDEADRTRWFHAADAETRRYLEPTNEQAGLSNGRLRVTLHNYGDGSVVSDDRWVLVRLHDDGWKRVAPFPVGSDDDGSTTIHPGEERVTTIRTDNRPRLDHADPATVGGLTPGRYAVVFPRVELWRGNSRESTTSFAALVELVGNAPDLSPSSMVQATTRNGDTLDVLASGESEPSSAVVAVERLSGTPDRSLVLAQVLQFQVLRDTLAYLVGGEVDRVVLRTTPSRLNRYALAAATLELPTVDGGGVEFTFDGVGYRVSL